MRVNSYPGADEKIPEMPMVAFVGDTEIPLEGHAKVGVFVALKNALEKRGIESPPEPVQIESRPIEPGKAQ